MWVHCNCYFNDGNFKLFSVYSVNPHSNAACWCLPVPCALNCDAPHPPGGPNSRAGGTTAWNVNNHQPRSPYIPVLSDGHSEGPGGARTSGSCE